MLHFFLVRSKASAPTGCGGVVWQVLQDVRIVIADQLGIELESIPPETKFADIGADSLDTVEIMMALEEKFELTLDEEGARNHAFLRQSVQNDRVVPAGCCKMSCVPFPLHSISEFPPVSTIAGTVLRTQELCF